jgi:putative colanic acid biosynthesis acetyltransferase WcaF
MSQKIKMLLWQYVWYIGCAWTPKPANGWRLFWLKIFGARISGKPFVHQRARILIPWNLTMHHRSCVGDRANIYSLGKIEIREYATVAQEAYICTGTHRFDKRKMNLVTAPIIIEENAFIGARAFLNPGVTIGKYCVVGAGSMVTKDMPDWMICAGNPCVPIKPRTITD